MKKLLPKLINNSQAFTLIELMVVISIIAILAIVGLSIYGSVQKNARDGIRISEITSLGKSIEGSKDPTQSAVVYNYDATRYATDYPQTKPADPTKTTGLPQYCVAVGLAPAVQPPPAPANWAANSACPADAATANFSAWTTIVNFDSTFGTAIANARYWRICAKMEAPTQATPPVVKCVTNSQ